jgi:hypothetical protein
MKKLAALLICLTAICLHAQPQPPKTEIHNKQLKLTVYVPGENQFYKGVRFEWGGWIGDLEFAGHHLYKPWFVGVDPAERDVAFRPEGIVVGTNTAMTGPAEEFQTPIGYDTAKPGDTFLKVGVGILRKANTDKYFFGSHFDVVDSGKWTVKKTATSVTATQVLGGPGKDYGYIYTKTIRLVGNTSQLVIEHSLKNTGKLPLSTRVYDHNFLTIDGLGVGPDYSVTAAYDIHPARPIDPKFVHVEGKTGTFVTALKDGDHGAIGLEGYGPDAKDYDYTVKNSAAHVAVHIVGDRPVINAMVWSIRSILAVEPFVAVQADPGKDFTWSYTYTYSSDSK